MSFIKEIVQSLGFDEIKIANGYQIVNFNGEALYAEGFKRLLNVQNDEITLELKKAKIIITGENLHIHVLEETTIIIKGTIKSYTLEAV